jgi:hypothetical protein
VPTTKRLDVRPSAGSGADPLGIPAELQDYCEALEQANPTTIETTLDPQYDCEQVHQAALTKSEQVAEEGYGLTVDWEGYVIHTVDPTDPRVWINDVNNRGVLYTATASGGGTWYFCVCPH